MYIRKAYLREPSNDVESGSLSLDGVQADRGHPTNRSECVMGRGEEEEEEERRKEEQA